MYDFAASLAPDLSRARLQSGVLHFAVFDCIKKYLQLYDVKNEKQ
jgi:hypothetical protein